MTAVVSERQRKLIVMVALRVVTVTAAALLVAIGLPVRPSIRAEAITEVLAKSDDAAFLSLENGNAQERIRTAKWRLAGQTADINGVCGELNAAEIVEDSSVSPLLTEVSAVARLDFTAAGTPGNQPDVEPEKQSPIQNSIGMSLKLLPAGRFQMGSTSGDPDEQPVHEVLLTAPFYMGVYEVTQDQFQQVMGTNPSSFQGQAKHPVENVSWQAAVEFCARLSSMPAEKSSGRVYRLPSEAEWEYACRAGTTTSYHFGVGASRLGEYAWFKDNSDRNTHPVGRKRPNAWGLYDMHGNVWEWCHDWKSDYLNGSVTNPKGPKLGTHRVYRGGSWRSKARSCRSADRFKHIRPPGYRDNRLGFRVALDVKT